MASSIIWFRQDLRLHDNPALQAAIASKQPVIPIYILETGKGPWPLGAASRWWLHHSLSALQHALHERGSELVILSGNALEEISRLCKDSDCTHVFWNRCYEPYAIKRDTRIKNSLEKSGVITESFNSALLTEPWNNVKDNGSPYRVFTPFWNTMQRRGITLYNSKTPSRLIGYDHKISNQSNCTIDDLSLLPENAWDSGFYETWKPGEQEALKRLKKFQRGSLTDYHNDRDIPAIDSTSLLSAHLHFGEISPWRIWQNIEAFCTNNRHQGTIKAAEAYLRQLGWRDFAHHLLYHFPDTHNKPLDARFNTFPWRKSYQKDFKAWQQGLTGIPIVDAGMRQLWRTGCMHNRVRMIAASLLTKNLLIPWQQGAKWFWDTLVDADLANNTMGWQWTAGCGADAAPFFRIFNPVRQGQRFDPDGSYVRTWIPELASLPEKWIHQPWEAPSELLADANFKLGEHYPYAIVDLQQSRQRALSIWNDIKSAR